MPDLHEVAIRRSGYQPDASRTNHLCQDARPTRSGVP